MSTAKIFEFRLPDTSSSAAVLAGIRNSLEGDNESAECVSYVLYAIDLIIEASGVGKQLTPTALGEAEYVEAVPLVRDVEHWYRQVSGSLIAELVIAHTRIWHLENGG